LLKDVEDRAYWRIFAMNAEREYQDEQTKATALVSAAITGASFRSSEQMLGFACEQIVAVIGRALTADEYDRFIIATTELWALATATPIVTFDITDAGRAAIVTQEHAA
jgi:hypothetical protein